MIKLNHFLFICVLLFSFSCVSQHSKQTFRSTIEAYYQTYQERDDFEKFLNFYAEDMVLEDVILGEKISGKAAFAEFFDWSNPNFSKTDSSTLIIESQIIDERQVLTKGYFTPFKWGDTVVEAMHFATILTFDEMGKIKKQVDWINYPNNLIDYNNRKNANQWILRNRDMVK